MKENRYTYRAKTVNNDRLFWVYGSYIKMLPYTPAPVRECEPPESDYKHLIVREDFSDWNMPRGLKSVEVLPETVGQCTGLKDKNGNYIYEGDVVRYAEYEIEDEDVEPDWEYGEIIWGDKYSYPAFDFKNGNLFDCNGLSYIFNEGWVIEVIGNIYDNNIRELIKNV